MFYYCSTPSPLFVVDELGICILIWMTSQPSPLLPTQVPMCIFVASETELTVSGIVNTCLMHTSVVWKGSLNAVVPFFLRDLELLLSGVSIGESQRFERYCLFHIQLMLSQGGQAIYCSSIL